MTLVTRHSIITVAVLALAALLIVVGYVWSGSYDIGADLTQASGFERGRSAVWMVATT